MDRFWAKVDRSGDCWLWTGPLSQGYGEITLSAPRRTARSHRVIFEIENGPIPAGMDVCHTCDVRACVRPSHLFAGTRADNMADAKEKGRIPHGSAHAISQNPELVARGEDHYMAKITADDVRAIRACGLPSSEAAARWGISRSNVDHIRKRATWKHVE